MKETWLRFSPWQKCRDRQEKRLQAAATTITYTWSCLKTSLKVKMLGLNKEQFWLFEAHNKGFYSIRSVALKWLRFHVSICRCIRRPLFDVWIFCKYNPRKSCTCTVFIVIFTWKMRLQFAFLYKLPLSILSLAVSINYFGVFFWWFLCWNPHQRFPHLS